MSVRKILASVALIIFSVAFTLGIMVFTEIGSTNIKEKGFYIGVFCGVVFFLMMSWLTRNYFKQKNGV